MILDPKIQSDALAAISSNSKTKKYFLWSFAIANLDLILTIFKQHEIIPRLQSLLGFSVCKSSKYAISMFCNTSNFSPMFDFAVALFFLLTAFILIVRFKSFVATHIIKRLKNNHKFNKKQRKTITYFLLLVQYLIIITVIPTAICFILEYEILATTFGKKTILPVLGVLFFYLLEKLTIQTDIFFKQNEEKRLKEHKTVEQLKKKFEDLKIKINSKTRQITELDETIELKEEIFKATELEINNLKEESLTIKDDNYILKENYYKLKEDIEEFTSKCNDLENQFISRSKAFENIANVVESNLSRKFYCNSDHINIEDDLFSDGKIVEFRRGPNLQESLAFVSIENDKELFKQERIIITKNINIKFHLSGICEREDKDKDNASMDIVLKKNQRILIQYDKERDVFVIKNLSLQTQYINLFKSTECAIEG